MKTIILGVGNAIMSDDGAGLYAVELINRQNTLADVHTACMAGVGLNLLDLLEGYERAFIVDSMFSDENAVGTVLRFTAEEQDRLKQKQYSHHNLGLQDTLSFGRQNGLKMPKEIVIYAVCARNVHTFGDQLSRKVQKGAEEAARQILKEIASFNKQ